MTKRRTIPKFVQAQNLAVKSDSIVYFNLVFFWGVGFRSNAALRGRSNFSLSGGSHDKNLGESFSWGP